MTTNLKSIIVVALLGSTMSACDRPASKPPAPTVAPTVAPAPATTAALGDSGVRYKAVSNLCDVLDLSALTEVMKKAQDPEPRRFKVGPLTNIRCNVSFGDLKAFSTLDAAATIYDDPQSALSTYQGLRGAQDAPTADIVGLGTAAYSYVDKVVGPHIAVYDGNLTLTFGLISFDSGAIPDDAIDRLARVAAATLPRLRA